MTRQGAVAASWLELRQAWTQVEAEVIEETLVTIYVNGRELATIMSTPLEQDHLALGFLKNEGFINGLSDVTDVHVSRDGCCVDVWLRHSVAAPKRMIITSGCGSGVTFDDPSIGIEPLRDEFRLEPSRLFDLSNELHYRGSLYARARGTHSAGLSDGVDLVVRTEDIGRHNTIDKLLGACLVQGIETRGQVLLATGRISSEMLRKGALMGCPIIASRNSPTSMSVSMAQAWNITLVGYVRRDSLRVYAHPERLGYIDAVQGVAGDRRLE
jgi:FdhD protein